MQEYEFLLISVYRGKKRKEDSSSNRNEDEEDSCCRVRLKLWWFSLATFHWDTQGDLSETNEKFVW
jgi:hypothetical protein